MKHLILSLVLLLSVSAISLAQSKSMTNDDFSSTSSKPKTVEPKDGSPSLDETMDWLKSKIKDINAHIHHQNGVDISLSYEIVRFDNGQLVLTHKSSYSRPSIITRSTNAYTIQMSELKAPVSVLTDEDGLYIELRYSDPNKKITSTGEIVKATGQSVSDNINYKIIRIYHPDKAEAEKIAKALSHAIQLCGGSTKKDPF